MLHPLPEQGVAGASPFDKGLPLSRRGDFDGLGQNGLKAGGTYIHGVGPLSECRLHLMRKRGAKWLTRIEKREISASRRAVARGATTGRKSSTAWQLPAKR